MIVQTYQTEEQTNGTTMNSFLNGQDRFERLPRHIQEAFRAIQEHGVNYDEGSDILFYLDCMETL